MDTTVIVGFNYYFTGVFSELDFLSPGTLMGTCSINIWFKQW